MDNIKRKGAPEMTKNERKEKTWFEFQKIIYCRYKWKKKSASEMN